MNDHIGDLADLYALGALDDADREIVDAHAAVCDDCARELGAASEIVTALDDTFLPKAERPASPFRKRTASFTPWTGALAAAVIFGAGFGTASLNRSQPPAPAEDSALVTIAGSHFLHVSLRVTTPAAPPAKVLYARDGSWLYAIVTAPAGSYRLRVRDEAGRVDVEPVGSGDDTVATLFEAPLSRRPVAVDLLRASDGTTVATATLVYSARP